jgi:hypothetical protein
VRIPIRFTLYIIYWAPIFSPPQLLLKSLIVIANGFLVLFCKGIWSSSTKYYHLNLLSSPPPTSTATHTVPILQTWFSLLIFKLAFKKVSKCMPTVGVIYFGPLTPPNSLTFHFVSHHQFVSECSVYRWDWDFEISLYYAVWTYLFLQTQKCLFYEFVMMFSACSFRIVVSSFWIGPFIYHELYLIWLIFE